MAGAGVPVSMDDGAGIAAERQRSSALCPEGPEVAQKWPLKGRALPRGRAVRVRRERVFFLGVGFPNSS